jgi:3-deoxy-D-manno-octulosonic-acid transferase
MYFWYKIFTYLIYPLSPIFLYLRKLKKKENKESYNQKLCKIISQRNDGFLIWFHVASVGEAMSILPLIEGCINNKNINNVLITSITLSSGKIINKKYTDNKKVVHQFLPLDIPVLTKKFIKHWKPNISIFIDSEIWPNLISQISRKKIPLLLINARITKKTFKRWKLVLNFAKKIFSKFDLTIVSNKESEDFLNFLGAKNIKNYGNIKFTQSKNTLNYNLNSSFLNIIKNRKIWCAASTHQNEEILCAKSHLKVKESYKNILTIIIPRHIDRAEKIKKDLANLNLNVVFFSESNLINENTDILIVDSYGESLKFYNIVKSVFVGKSLVDSLIEDSGQNPIEPARLGCRVFHGPNVSNFLEIYKYLKKLGVTQTVNNSDDLSLLLVEEFKNNEEKNDKIAIKVQNYGENIFNNVMIEIKKYIN